MHFLHCCSGMSRMDKQEKGSHKKIITCIVLQQLAQNRCHIQKIFSRAVTETFVFAVYVKEIKEKRDRVEIKK